MKPADVFDNKIFTAVKMKFRFIKNTLQYGNPDTLRLIYILASNIFILYVGVLTIIDKIF